MDSENKTPTEPAAGEQTWTPDEWRTAVTELSARAAKAFLYFVGTVQRAQGAAAAAEAAGVADAREFLRGRPENYREADFATLLGI
jgi:hypothetical protein